MNLKDLVLLLLIIWLVPSTIISGQQSDILKTNNGQIGIHPVLHGSFVLTYKNLTIAVDPYGGAERYSEFIAPDIVLITDIHGDHLHQKTLEGLKLDNATFIAPQAVFDQMTTGQQEQTAILNNGQGIHRKNIYIQAVPMYNLPETEESRHPKGRGNGYILSIAGKEIYISGDTEDIPEMRSLQNIDIAFVCMNLPYTMTVEQAANAVVEFGPDIVYPYHYRGSDLELFKALVAKGNKAVDVRIKDWYSDN